MADSDFSRFQIQPKTFWHDLLSRVVRACQPPLGFPCTRMSGSPGSVPNIARSPFFFNCLASVDKFADKEQEDAVADAAYKHSIGLGIFMALESPTVPAVPLDMDVALRRNRH